MRFQPNRWPLLDFGLVVWKLRIYIALWRRDISWLNDDYIFIGLDWNNKNVFRFKLYNTIERVIDRKEVKK